MVDEEHYCGAVDFRFIADSNVPLYFDNETGKLTLNPSIQSDTGDTMTDQFQFFFKDYPNLVWKVPIVLSVLECRTETVKMAKSQVLVRQEIGKAGQTLALPKIEAEPECNPD